MTDINIGGGDNNNDDDTNYDEYNDDNVQTGGSDRPAAGKKSEAINEFTNNVLQSGIRVTQLPKVKLSQVSPATPATPATTAAAKVSKAPQAPQAELTAPKTPLLVPAPALVPAPVHAPANLQDNSLRYIGVHQKELQKHITIDDNGKLKKQYVQEFYTYFKTLLDSIKKIKANATTQLTASENLKATNNQSYYDIIKQHLQNNENFKHVRHKLDFKCYKDTLTEINVSSNETEKEKITQYIAIAFAEHDKKTFHSIPGTIPNIVNYFRRVNTTRNNEKWNNIPSNNKKKKLHTVSSDTEIPKHETYNVSEIQKYINTCDIHQESYNEKHNELIKLFNVLQKILTNITKLINIIKLISSITPVNRKSTIANFVIDMPQTLFDTDINDFNKLKTQLDTELDTELDTINSIRVTNENLGGGGDYNNMQGGASGNVSSVNFTISDNGNNNYSLKIPEDNKEHFENAKQIKITQNTNVFIFKVDTMSELDLTLKLQQTKNIFNIVTFNKLDLRAKLLSINIVKIGIKHKYTAGIMQSIAHATTSILQNSIKHATSNKVFKPIAINDTPEAETIEFIKEHKDRIEIILFRCYDLQALYLIKYFEIIALFKYIIFFCNIFVDCICVCNFIILLYETIDIDLETLPEYIYTKKIVKDIQGMLGTHQEITTLMEHKPSDDVSGGNADSADSVVSAISAAVSADSAVSAGSVINLNITNVPLAKPNKTEDSNADMGYGLFNGGASLVGGEYDINTICNEIYYNDTNDNNELHALYVKLYNVLDDNSKTNVNTTLPKSPDSKNFSNAEHTLSNAELLFSYSILYDKYVIPYIRKNFNTHSYNTYSGNTKTIIATNTIKQQINEITLHFAKFDCNNNANKCISLNVFDPKNNITSDRKSIYNVLTVPPFNFTIINIIDGSETKHYIFEFYKLLFNAAKAGFIDYVKADYDKMIEYVNKQLPLGDATSNVSTSVNVKYKVLGVILEAKEAAEEQRLAEEQRVTAAKEAADKAAAEAAAEHKAAATPAYVIENYKKQFHDQENMNIINALAFSRNKLFNITTQHYDDANLTKLLEYNELKYDKDTPLNKDYIIQLFKEASEIITEITTFTTLSVEKDTDTNENHIKRITDEGNRIIDSITQFSKKEFPLKQIIDHLKTKISFIYEMIGGAAKVFVRIKPYESIAAQAAGGTRTSEQTIQDGGYKYNDIINIDSGDKFTIKISDKCNTLLAKDNKKYGPFAGIFTPNYNNFNVYEHLFGGNTIQKYIDVPKTTNKPTVPEYKANSDYAIVTNTPYDLTKTLSEGRNVVLFGYGFSGSGKTYTLVEGSEIDKSLLEQFIEKNANYITSVEFLELYPLGHGNTGKIKIICGSDSVNDTNIHGINGRNDINYLVNELYNTINKSNGTNITFNAIITQIVNINAERRTKLRILATPNNDDSSRSYLQITINLTMTDTRTSKLVIFDMPGSENTVRIRQELLGTETFEIIKQKTEEISTKVSTQFEDTSISLRGTRAEKIKNIGIFNTYFKLISTATQVATSTDIHGIQKIKDISDISETNKLNVKIVITEIFKNILITGAQLQTILQKCYKTTDDISHFQIYIGKLSEEITLFYNNKLSITSILDLKADSKVKSEIESRITMINKSMIKQIVKHFLTTVIFQKHENLKAKNGEIIYKYFKLVPHTQVEKNTAKPDFLPLSDTDKYNINRIYFGDGISIDNIVYIDYIDLKTITDNNDIRPAPSFEPTTYTFFYTDDNNKCVMIKYFVIFMNLIYKNFKNNDALFYNALLIFVYKYVKFIIDQGSAIVTTLEHLKYFFLSNINKIDEYNTNNTEQAMRLYDSTDTQKTTSILTTERIYTTPTKLTFKNKLGSQTSITLNERVNFGNMSDYKLLSILQKLSNSSTTLEDYTKDANGKPTSTFNLQKNTAEQGKKSQALFIMLAHIKCFSGDRNNTLNEKGIDDPELNNTLQKICTAQSDTLIFAQSISSTSQGVPIVAAAHGGSITNSNSQHKTKKNIKKFDFNTLYKTKNKDNKHKSFTIKKKYNNVNQSIFKIKSKKQ